VCATEIGDINRMPWATKKMAQKLKSVEIAETALFASILTVVDVLTYEFTWPGLAPIVIVPFITSFVLAMSLLFTKN
jgi:hypothetical protein